MEFPAAYGPRPPWHDLQAEVRGPAVHDLEHTFRERWYGSSVLDLSSPVRQLYDRAYHIGAMTSRPLPEPLAADEARRGPHAVQVLRTYPARLRRYPFAPHGERSISRAYQKAFARARRLVYLEDQYLWSRPVAGLIAAALRDQPGLHVIAVVPRHPDKDGAITRAPAVLGQHEVIRACAAAGGDRFAVYDLENHPGTPVYVHAKVVVVDDVWAMVGSDNLNRRSWSHDSELSIAVLDADRDPREPRDPAGLGDGARAFARDLRLRLWREHLDRDAGDVADLLAAPEACAAFRRQAEALAAWHRHGRPGPRPPGRVQPHQGGSLRPSERLWATPLYRMVYDPDGRPWRDRLRGGSEPRAGICTCERPQRGQLGGHVLGTLDRPRRSLAPLIAVIAAAVVFTILLAGVRLRWAPLESVDHGAAAHLNSLVAGHAVLVTVVKAVTWLGSDGVLWTVIAASALVLALRKRWRLAIYLLVTGAGALVLDPMLKSLVGRLRPVVAHPIAHGAGNSFPSGHALGSIVCYGAVFLVFLPATRGRWRTALTAAVVALIALIGISRILLGVHYLSDVVGAWAVGILWLGITAFAFELTRQAGRAAGDRPGYRGAGARGQGRPQAGQARAHRAGRAGPPSRPRRCRNPDRLGADRRRRHRIRRADHQGRERQRARRPDDPALVCRAPLTRLEPLQPDLHHPRRDHGDPDRVARRPAWSSSPLPGAGGRSSTSAPSCSANSPPSLPPPRSSSGQGRTSRTSTIICPRRPIRPGTRPPPAASGSR